MGGARNQFGIFGYLEALSYLSQYKFLRCHSTKGEGSTWERGVPWRQVHSHCLVHVTTRSLSEKTYPARNFNVSKLNGSIPVRAHKLLHITQIKSLWYAVYIMLQRVSTLCY